MLCCISIPKGAISSLFSHDQEIKGLISIPKGAISSSESLKFVIPLVRFQFQKVQLVGGAYSDAATYTKISIPKGAISSWHLQVHLLLW